MTVPNDKLLELVKARVLQLDPAAEVILYGSQARGEAHAESDWDFLILLSIAATEPIKRQIRDALFEVELETDEVISTIIKNKEAWEALKITPLYQNIEAEGIAV